MVGCPSGLRSWFRKPVGASPQRFESSTHRPFGYTIIMAENQGDPTRVDDKIDVPSSSKETTYHEPLIHSAVKFAEYLTSKWPQTNSGHKISIEVDDQGTTVDLPELPSSVQTEPQLNYYLAGSLAAMLLSRAKSFTVLDENRIPALSNARTIEVPEEVSRIFAAFARPIGDLDYVPMEDYKRDPNRLKKGGGGPSFVEIPEDALLALKKAEGQLKIMCDPAWVYGSQRVAKVTVEDHDYFIARPDSILGYKMLHILQSYDKNPDKFNEDFSKLLPPIRGMYSEEELLQTTYQILGDYEDTMHVSHDKYWTDKIGEYQPKLPALTEKVLANQQLSPEIRSFIGNLQAIDKQQSHILQYSANATA